MEEITDPVVDALRGAARAQDTDLDTAEVRAAIAAVTPWPQRRHPARMVMAAASLVAVAGIGGWQVVAPRGEPIDNTRVDTNDVQLVAASFDAAAAQFPLPKGHTYDALRSQVLSNATGDDADAKKIDESVVVFIRQEGTMPKEGAKGRSDAMAALVARYSGCKWWELEANHKFDEMSSQEQASVQKRNQKALAAVLKATKNPDQTPQTELWDELCKGAK